MPCWAAGLLAALAVRPVPSCTISLTRSVRYRSRSNAYLGKRLAAWDPLQRPISGMHDRAHRRDDDA